MPVTLKTIDFNSEFSKLRPGEFIILNDLPNRTEEDRKRFEYLIKDTHTSDMVSVLPKCYCGDTYGEHMVGEVCPKCHEPVRQVIEDDIRSMLWFRKPQGVRALINPIAWIMLKKRFTKRHCNVVQWLCDRNYVPGQKPDILAHLVADQVPRGLNNFIDNFDEIFKYLMKSDDFKGTKFLHDTMKGMIGLKTDDDPLEFYIRENRHLLFPEQIPIPNKALLVVEKNHLGQYLENHVLDMNNILNTMVSIDQDHYDKNKYKIENRTAKIQNMLGDYYLKYIATNLRPKPGHFRKHIYGTRGNFTFRTVITSHDGPHDYDEIHIPWGVAVTTFWLHHMAILTKSDHPLGGMSHTEATAFLMDHVGKYHPRLDQLFQFMIQSHSKTRGMPCLMQRN